MTRQSIKFSVVDAFAKQAFGGNPAAIVVLDSYLDDKLLSKIAREFNLSETAFLVPKHAGSTHEFHLRWFTPSGTEVELCGHATLAASHVLFSTMTHEQQQAGPLRFHTLSGELVVKFKDGDAVAKTSLLEMSFPELPVTPDESVDRDLVARAFGIKPQHILFVGTHPSSRLLVEIDSTETPIDAIVPDFGLIAQLDSRVNVLTTSTGSADKGYDFFSRMFAPKVDIPEDPVCGSAHCSLAVYWGEKLGKTSLKAYQASERGGELFVVHDQESGRVHLSGYAVTVSEGTMFF